MISNLKFRIESITGYNQLGMPNKHHKMQPHPKAKINKNEQIVIFSKKYKNDEEQGGHCCVEWHTVSTFIFLTYPIKSLLPSLPNILPTFILYVNAKVAS